MRSWRRHITAILINDRQAIFIDNQGIGAATVVRIKHAGVDFYNATAKALKNLSTRRRCVANYDSVCVNSEQCSGQLVGFHQFTAYDIAPIPQRAAERVKIRIIQCFHRIDSLGYLGTCILQWHSLIQDIRMIIEGVRWQQNFRVLQNLQLAHVFDSFISQRAVDALQTDLGDHW